jgi:phage gp29-like protein
MIEHILSTLRGAAATLLAPIRGPQGRDIPTPPRPTGGGIVTVRTQDLWGTYPSAGLTPQKLATVLKEADQGVITRAMELAEEIEAKSARILSGLQTRKRAVQRLQWTVTPASDSPRDVEIADFVRKNLTDCGLRKPVYHLLDAIYKGFAALWINWRIDQGQIWLGSLEWTPQTRWTLLPRDYAPDAAAPQIPRLLTAQDPIHGEEPGAFYWLIHTDSTRSTLPHKAGLWRTVVWYWMFGNFSLKDWITFLDRYGVPFKLGKYPAGMDRAEIDVLKAAVQAAGDSGAVISDQTLLEIIESKSTGSDMHESLARYCDEQITLVILGQTASTQGTPGKLGNETAQSDVREELVEADAADLAETIQMGLIWPLVGWNFGWDVLLPQFGFTVGKIEDLEKEARTYGLLVEMGIPVTVAQAQEKFGIRPPEGDEAVLRVPSVPAPIGGSGQGRLAAVTEDTQGATAGLPSSADAQAERMETETARAWTAIMDGIKTRVAAAESLPALRDALLAAYGELPSKELGEIMAMGFAAAELSGRFAVVDESATAGPASRATRAADTAGQASSGTRASSGTPETEDARG